MPPQPDPVNATLDSLVAAIHRHFHAFLLAHTTLSLGGPALNSIDDAVAVQTAVGLNITIEPIPVRELKAYREVFPNFLLEVFHGRLIQIWHECLTEVFCHYVGLHLAGTRRFSELKVMGVRVDFRLEVEVGEQIRESLIRDFEFQKYSEQQKLINSLRNQANVYPEHLANIHKNVLMRNALQHTGGRVDGYLLRSLGTDQIEVLDPHGQRVALREGEQIQISIPEFDGFCRSLRMMSQAWRS